MQSAFDYLDYDDKDLCDLLDLAESNSYWEKACEFVISLKDMDKGELSANQTTWAVSIKDQLDDMRRKGKI